MDKLIIRGNLGRDPEIRYVADGTPVVNFSIAANRRWNDSDGNKVEQTAWYRCSAWRRLAEVIYEYAEKGRSVLVEGELRIDPETGGPRVFTRQDGSTGASYEVTVRNFEFCGGRSEAGEAPADSPDEEDETPIPF